MKDEFSSEIPGFSCSRREPLRLPGVKLPTRSELYTMIHEHVEGFCGVPRRKGKRKVYAPITGGSGGGRRP